MLSFLVVPAVVGLLALFGVLEAFRAVLKSPPEKRTKPLFVLALAFGLLSGAASMPLGFGVWLGLGVGLGVVLLGAAAMRVSLARTAMMLATVAGAWIATIIGVGAAL